MICSFALNNYFKAKLKSWQIEVVLTFWRSFFLSKEGDPSLTQKKTPLRMGRKQPFSRVKLKNRSGWVGAGAPRAPLPIFSKSFFTSLTNLPFGKALWAAALWESPLLFALWESPLGFGRALCSMGFGFACSPKFLLACPLGKLACPLGLGLLACQKKKKRFCMSGVCPKKKRAGWGPTLPQPKG